MIPKLFILYSKNKNGIYNNVHSEGRFHEDGQSDFFFFLHVISEDK